MLSALLNLLLAGSQLFGCGSQQERVELMPGVEVKLHIQRNAVEAQKPTMVYVDEQGADFSLRLLDATDRVLIRSDAAPSRAARERMVIPSGMSSAIIRFAIPATAKQSHAMVTVVCAPISTTELSLFEGAAALADSEELPEAKEKLKARKRAIAYFEAVLAQSTTAAANPAVTPLQRAQALHNLGFLLRRDGRFNESYTAYSQAQALWQVENVPMAAANAILEKIQIDAQQQRYEQALALLKANASQIGKIDAGYDARMANDECFMLKRIGVRAAIALSCYQRAQVQATRANDFRAAGGALFNQVAELRDLGKSNEVEISLTQLFRDYGNYITPQVYARALLIRSNEALRRGQLSLAMGSLEQANVIAQKSGIVEIQIDILSTLSSVYLELSDAERAKQLVLRHLDLAKLDKYPLQHQMALIQLVRVHRHLRQFDDAEMVLRQFPSNLKPANDQVLEQQRLEQSVLLALDQKQPWLANQLLAKNAVSVATRHLTTEISLQAGKMPNAVDIMAALDTLSASRRARILTLLAARTDSVSKTLVARHFHSLIEIANSLQDPVVLAAWLADFDGFVRILIAAQADLDPNLAMQTATEWSAAGYGNNQANQQLRESAYRQLFQSALAGSTESQPNKVAIELFASANKTPEPLAFERIKEIPSTAERFCHATVAMVRHATNDTDLVLLVQIGSSVRAQQLPGAATVLQQAEKILMSPESSAPMWHFQLQLVSQAVLVSAIELGIKPEMRVCLLEPFVTQRIPWALVPVPEARLGVTFKPKESIDASIGAGTSTRSALWIERNTLLSTIGDVRGATKLGTGTLQMISSQAAETVATPAGLPAQALEWAAMRASFGLRAEMAYSVSSLKEWQRLTAKRPALLHISSHGVLSALAGESGLAANANQPAALSYFELARGKSSVPIVILSACFSAQIPTSGARLNPASAFLRSGTHIVIAAANEVPDAQIAQLFTRFYVELGTTMDPVSSFRTAQIAILNSPHVRDARAIASVQIWKSQSTK